MGSIVMHRNIFKKKYNNTTNYNPNVIFPNAIKLSHKIQEYKETI